MSIYTKGNMVVPAIVVVAVLALLAGGYYMMQNNGLNMSTSKTSPMMPRTSDMPSNAMYKDGSYEATGNYTSPGGDEEVEVMLTIKDGVIIDATVTPMATRPNSVKFQGIFKDNFKPMVVGKKLDEVSLTKVSGSSLTPNGFNEALSEIKLAAKS